MQNLPSLTPDLSDALTRLLAVAESEDRAAVRRELTNMQTEDVKRLFHYERVQRENADMKLKNWDDREDLSDLIMHRMTENRKKRDVNS